MTEIKQEAVGVADMARKDLVAHWRMHFGTAPPKGISRRILVHAVAYHTQCQQHGGLRPAVARKLEKLADGRASACQPPLQMTPRLPTGTRLVREWNGISHIVDVTDGGFLWRGSRYRSLSAVARQITGTHWSGPRFFGLSSDR